MLLCYCLLSPIVSPLLGKWANWCKFRVSEIKVCEIGSNRFLVVFLIRDQNFMVSTVSSQDVIHAGAKLIPAIFKVHSQSY